MKRKIETIFSGIFTLQFPEFEIADHDVKRVEEGAKESWYSIPETAFDKITPEESGSRSEQKITQVIDGIDLHALLQHLHLPLAKLPPHSQHAMESNIPRG